MASVYIQLPLMTSTISGTVPVVFDALVPDFQEKTNVTNSAQVFTAPVGAKWAKISAGGQNSAALRFKIGGAATATSGIKLEPSRTEDLGAVGDISVICETAAINQYVCVLFGY